MFEQKLPCCPSCGHSKNDVHVNSFSGSHFYVHKCSNCGKGYCHKCSGSNNGKKCPACGHTGKTTQGIVYLT